MLQSVCSDEYCEKTNNQTNISVQPTDVSNFYTSENGYASDLDNDDGSYSFQHMEIMFSSINFNTFNDPMTLWAFDLHQGEHKYLPHCSGDPSTDIQNYIFAA